MRGDRPGRAQSTWNGIAPGTPWSAVSAAPPGSHVHKRLHDRMLRRGMRLQDRVDGYEEGEGDAAACHEADEGVTARESL
jgi:hypothetical protein